MPADFEKQSYWRDRFTHETSFEWLLPSSDDLQNHLRSRGFSNVSNLDYEPLAAERGRKLEEKAFGNVVMLYTVADATHLALTGPEIGHRGDGKFDLVLDKSTVDAVSCGGQTAFRRMANGVRRCLADDAVWISLSYSATRFDDDMLPFRVETIAKIPAPKYKASDPDVYYWCYLCRPA